MDALDSQISEVIRVFGVHNPECPAIELEPYQMSAWELMEPNIPPGPKLNLPSTPWPDHDDQRLLLTEFAHFGVDKGAPDGDKQAEMLMERLPDGSMKVAFFARQLGKYEAFERFMRAETEKALVPP